MAAKPKKSGSKLLNPQLFSQQFKLPAAALAKAGLFDPLLNADTKLFIDPLLLRRSKNTTLSGDGLKAFRRRMANVLNLVLAKKDNSGPAWKAALRELNLDERPETCLGYGGKGTSGSSAPDTLKTKILETAREIGNLGFTNPEIIGLMGMFEEGVGPDTISDLTTNSILPVLEKITQDFCKRHGIPITKLTIRTTEVQLPENPLKTGTGVLLVPKDVLRELPVATDWSDIDRVVSHNEMLREQVNKYIGDIHKATVLEKKRALRAIAVGSGDNFRKIMDEFLSGEFDGYDFESDKKNFDAMRQLLATTALQYPLNIVKPKDASKGELERVVGEIIAQFKHLVEENDLWRMLWDGDKPKTEKAAQLLLFAVADSYCKANNIEIAPEVHSGGGPVDFRFSQGYEVRVLVEMKLSKGAVEHGYAKQLERYKKAHKTESAFFLVVDVGGMGKKLRKIQDARQKKLDAGEYASAIIVVDAKGRPSASKDQQLF